MPSGFEHNSGTILSLTSSALRLPLMPSGFEHPVMTVLSTKLIPLRLPLMPSGFEHYRTDPMTATR